MNLQVAMNTVSGSIVHTPRPCLARAQQQPRSRILVPKDVRTSEAYNKWLGDGVVVRNIRRHPDPTATQVGRVGSQGGEHETNGMVPEVSQTAEGSSTSSQQRMRDDRRAAQDLAQALFEAKERGLSLERATHVLAAVYGDANFQPPPFTQQGTYTRASEESSTSGGTFSTGSFQSASLEQDAQAHESFEAAPAGGGFHQDRPSQSQAQAAEQWEAEGSGTEYEAGVGAGPRGYGNGAPDGEIAVGPESEGGMLFGAENYVNDLDSAMQQAEGAQPLTGAEGRGPAIPYQGLEHVPDEGGLPEEAVAMARDQRALAASLAELDRERAAYNAELKRQNVSVAGRKQASQQGAEQRLLQDAVEQYMKSKDGTGLGN